jgi:hypothetical protein
MSNELRELCVGLNRDRSLNTHCDPLSTAFWPSSSSAGTGFVWGAGSGDSANTKPRTHDGTSSMGPRGFQDVKWDDVVTRCPCESDRSAAEHAGLQKTSISSATSASIFYYSKFCFGHVKREVAGVSIITQDSAPEPGFYKNFGGV